jgi:hypothetical protein
MTGFEIQPVPINLDKYVFASSVSTVIFEYISLEGSLPKGILETIRSSGKING